MWGVYSTHSRLRSHRNVRRALTSFHVDLGGAQALALLPLLLVEHKVARQALLEEGLHGRAGGVLLIRMHERLGRARAAANEGAQADEVGAVDRNVAPDSCVELRKSGIEGHDARSVPPLLPTRTFRTRKCQYASNAHLLNSGALWPWPSDDIVCILPPAKGLTRKPTSW